MTVTRLYIWFNASSLNISSLKEYEWRTIFHIKEDALAARQRREDAKFNKQVKNRVKFQGQSSSSGDEDIEMTGASS